MANVADFLYRLQLGDKGRPGTLRHLAYVIGEAEYNASKNAAKEEAIAVLSKYYGVPDRFEKLWNSLSDAERKIISFHVWSGGFEPVSCADDVAKEFGVDESGDNRRYFIYPRNGLDKFKERYAKHNSPLWLLFPSGYEAPPFYDKLRAAAGEMKRVYRRVSAGFAFSSRENRTVDFINIVRFCNANKLTVTKSGFLSKSSALKLMSFCGYDEFAADFNLNPSDMRTAQGLLVTLPLTVISAAGGLLAVTEGECVPGSKAVSLVNLPHEDLVKKLFNAYLNSKTFDEISLMTRIKAKRGHRPYEARQNLAAELKHCPVETAVYTSEFESYLRIGNKTFARRDERYVAEAGNSNYDYIAEWEIYESPLIRHILSFFHALGIVDVTWAKGKTVSGRATRVPQAFKINALGAYVLGLSGSYAAPVQPGAKKSGGFTLLPDYTVIVPDSSDRVKHEMFFEKLLGKVSSNEEAVIYKLDFGGVVRAIDGGIGVEGLRNYLAASDKPVPENVARALDDWERQSNRIKLRQVTVLECDDEALLEEVIRYKGMGGLVKEKILSAVVVDGGATKDIKKLIEKNKRFCRDVL